MKKTVPIVLLAGVLMVLPLTGAAAQQGKSDEKPPAPKMVPRADPTTARPLAFAGNGVRFFEQAQVKQAFAATKPLMQGKNFTVLPAHRDKPGEAEVHAKDTDV